MRGNLQKKKTMRQKLALQIRQWVFPSRIFQFMTSKIVHHERNDHIICNFFDFDAMISSLAKVMGLQSCQKQGPKTTSLK